MLVQLRTAAFVNVFQYSDANSNPRVMTILDTRREAALQRRVTNRLIADKVADVAAGDMTAEGLRNFVLRVKCRHRDQSLGPTDYEPIVNGTCASLFLSACMLVV